MFLFLYLITQIKSGLQTDTKEKIHSHVGGTFDLKNEVSTVELHKVMPKHTLSVLKATYPKII